MAGLPASARLTSRDLLRITHLGKPCKGLPRWVIRNQSGETGQARDARMSLKVADGRITAAVFSASGR